MAPSGGEMSLPEKCGAERERKNRLGLGTTYSDGYEEIAKVWTPSLLPDYRCHDMSGKESDSLAYVEELQRNYRRHGRALALFSPDTVNDSSQRRLRKKMSVWEEFSGTVEEALRKGSSKCPIPGPIHPRQKSLHVLRLNRRSGYSNNFTFEDYLDLQPLCPLPPLNDSQ